MEREVSDLVNQAYGLTPDEVRLMWQIEPPRMPIDSPTDVAGVGLIGPAKLGTRHLERPSSRGKIQSRWLDHWFKSETLHAR